jgi:biopolymer transport protein ExbB
LFKEKLPVDWKHIAAANGPFFLGVFAILFLASFLLIFWRWLLNRSAKTDLADFLHRLKEDLTAGRREDAIAMCEEETGAVAKVFRTALETSPQGKVATRNAMIDKIELEIIPDLNFLLPWILVLAKLAPMIGLLGTVWGMIGAFDEIALAVKPEPDALAGDIGMALFTTAEGLMIAIPLIFAYTMFRERVNRFEVDLQRAAQAAMRIFPLMAALPSRPTPPPLE